VRYHHISDAVGTDSHHISLSYYYHHCLYHNDILSTGCRYSQVAPDVKKYDVEYHVAVAVAVAVSEEIQLRCSTVHKHK
jgi:hypothetical protein